MGRSSGGSGEGASIPTVLVSPSNTSAQNKALIDAALAAAATRGNGSLVDIWSQGSGPCLDLGGHIIPSGTRVTWFGGQWRPGLTPESILQLDPATSATYWWAGSVYAAGGSGNDYGINFDHMPLDCNGVSIVPLGLAGRNCRINDNGIYNWQGANSGIVIGQSTPVAGQTLQEVRIRDNELKIIGAGAVAASGRHGIYFIHGTGGSQCTDSWISGNLISGMGDSAIRVDLGANVNCDLNHIYNPVSNSPDISYGTASGVRIAENEFDESTRPNLNTDTNVIIQVDTLTSVDQGTSGGPFFEPLQILGNRMHADESNGSGAATWQYIKIASTVQGGTGTTNAVARIAGNVITQDMNGSGTSSPYVFGTGSGNPNLLVYWDPGVVTGPTIFTGSWVQASGGGPAATVINLAGPLNNGSTFITANTGALTAGSANELTGTVSTKLWTGTYLITGMASISGSSSAGQIDVYVNPATTGGGVLASPFGNGFGASIHALATGNQMSVSFSAVVTVTTSGKFDLWVNVPAAMTGTVIAVAGGSSGVTGAGTIRNTGLAWTQLS